MASTHLKHHSKNSSSSNSPISHRPSSSSSDNSLAPPPYSAEQKSPTEAGLEDWRRWKRPLGSSNYSYEGPLSISGQADGTADENPSINKPNPETLAEGVPSGPPDLSARLANLSLDEKTPFPTADQCIAHLKLLEAFQNLRDEVASHEGLFGITPPPADLAADSTALARVREKRWAVFVARAVDRFEMWWTKCLPPTFNGLPYNRLSATQFKTSPHKHISFILDAKEIAFSTDTMPPLDVLMVWHSYLLNPRSYFEDCWRYGKLDLYATGLPWEAIDGCIDNVTFQYVTSAAAKSNFEGKAGRFWRNLDDQDSKTFPCGKCSRTVSVPWTAGYEYREPEFAAGYGYADRDFAARCEYCTTYYNHDVLRAEKFRHDVELVLEQDCPLPGTVTSAKGLLPPGLSERDVLQCYFPNWLVVEARDRYLEPNWELSLDPSSSPNMEKIRDGLDAALRDIEVLTRLIYCRRNALQGRNRKEKFAMRRMMSRYWFNSSPFALDLVGAVIRQGLFVEKMHNIDWLHSPALKSTMDRLIKKYGRFFAIMAENPGRMAVPTLDVDLAWHTHQLAPRAYYLYSDKHAHSLIDHDDKVEENDLSDAFAWTSKMYQAKYGEPYSACTCWYCEAVRESHTSSLSRIFKSKSYAASKNLHDAPDAASSDPLKSPHISAHNAIRDQNSEAKARVNAAKLDKAYHQACARARKEGRKEPKRDEYFYTYTWGYPMLYPGYVPYAVDPCLASNRHCYATHPYKVDRSPEVITFFEKAF
ncbi:hypothetical protein H2201_002245 [Coniosporium apollinis]|uniref:Alpha-ketoglutarate-dependent sulfonate dioxygenase n=1 Tax=Coniosporium apollinis TaxID=61459 RepID=A0ABQ9NZB6_9PEZI|nr:hypothetical protein H2201_002245 [Coniosporium apollinis]